MANYGGENYTGFKGVNLRNSAAIRLELDGGLAGTLSAKASPDSSRSWQFPDKSGSFGITGTFSVDIPIVTSWGETAVTVAGIRAEDALVVQIQKMVSTVTTGRTFPIIAGAKPENGYIYLTFYNPTGTATIGQNGVICSYTAVR